MNNSRNSKENQTIMGMVCVRHIHNYMSGLEGPLPPLFLKNQVSFICIVKIPKICPPPHPLCKKNSGFAHDISLCKERIARQFFKGK